MYPPHRQDLEPWTPTTPPVQLHPVDCLVLGFQIHLYITTSRCRSSMWRQLQKRTDPPPPPRPTISLLLTMKLFLFACASPSIPGSSKSCARILIVQGHLSHVKIVCNRKIPSGRPWLRYRYMWCASLAAASSLYAR